MVSICLHAPQPVYCLRRSIPLGNPLAAHLHHMGKAKLLPDTLECVESPVDCIAGRFVGIEKEELGDIKLLQVRHAGADPFR